MDDVLRDARVNRAKELVKEYARRETRGVMLIDDLLAKAGETIDSLLVRHLKN